MSELRWILLGFGIALIAGIYLWGRKWRPDRNELVRAAAPLPERPEPDYRELEIPPHLRHGETSTLGEAPDSYGARTEPLDDAPDELPAVPSVGDASRTPREDQSDPVRAVERAVATPTFQRTRREPSLGPLVVDSGAAPARRSEPRIDARAETAGESRRAEPHGNDEPRAATTNRQAPAAARRQIFAVRLVAPVGHRYAGSSLLTALTSEQLQHGRYGIFHSLHEGGASVFSVASMVEPGSFDLDSIHGTEYPGLTFFTLVPGPRPGGEAVNAMIECAERLQRVLGGALQDERGVPLQDSRLDEMQLQASMVGTAPPTSADPPHVH